MELNKIQAAAERVARSLGLEVVEVEWKIGKDRFLRVTIDRPAATEAQGSQSGSSLKADDGDGTAGIHPGEQRGPAAQGISHKDCEAVSNQLSVILDVEDLVPSGRYVLEVSSPGLDRKLLKPADYQRFAGRRAKISLAEPVENSKFYEGRLAGFAEGNVQVEVQGRVVTLPLASIRKANLVVEF